MDICTRYLKGALFILNLIFLAVGIALTSMGAIDLHGHTFSTLRTVPLVLTSIGALVMLVSVVALLGVCCHSYYLVVLHATLLGLLAFAQLCACLGVYLSSDRLMHTLVQQMRHQMQLYGQPDARSATKAWDAVQMEFDCCGVDNYTNWLDTGFGRNESSAPDSCCLTPTDKCGQGAAGLPADLAGARLHTGGCLSAVQLYVQNHAPVIAGVIGAIMGVQVLVVLLGCCLAQVLKSGGYSRTLTTV